MYPIIGDLRFKKINEGIKALMFTCIAEQIYVLYKNMQTHQLTHLHNSLQHFRYIGLTRP